VSGTLGDTRKVASPGRGPLRSRQARGVLLAGAAILVALGVALLLISATASNKPPLRYAKPFTLTELGHAGQQISLASFAGRPVILNFFASWCAPCKKETPLLASFYRQHDGRVLIIGIDSADQESAALSFIHNEQVGYPVGFDPIPASTAVAYGAVQLPQTFFLNAKHQIVRHISGDLTRSELESWANSLGDG
jgi:cytochrome c biogenesis protein CcmG, thiol:disulfide interchange protein DsbE